MAGSGTVWLLDPTAEDQPDEHPVASRLTSLRGAKVGLIDNTKHNSDSFLAILGEELQSRYGVTEVFSVRKANANSAATPELLDDAASRADALVHAVAD